MTKKELVLILKRNLKVLKEFDDDKKFNIIHSIETGNGVGDSYEIEDFDIDFGYDKDLDMLYIDYMGLETKKVTLWDN